MANFKFITLMATALLLLSAFTIGKQASWTIDENHSIRFETKKAKGQFNEFEGNITFDENDLNSSSFDVKILVESIITGNWLKNRHAKGEDWFNAEQFPEITFISQQFNKSTRGYEVTGLLTMRGIEKQITMPFTFQNNVFKSSFSVDRTTFNIGGTTGMQGKVGHEVTLDIAVPVKK